jgi:hypothetical protein
MPILIRRRQSCYGAYVPEETVTEHIAAGACDSPSTTGLRRSPAIISTI